VNLNLIHTVVIVTMPDCGTAYVSYSKPSAHIYLLHSTLTLLCACSHYLRVIRS